MPMEYGNKLTLLMANKLIELVLAVPPVPSFTAFYYTQVFAGR